MSQEEKKETLWGYVKRTYLGQKDVGENEMLNCCGTSRKKEKKNKLVPQVPQITNCSNCSQYKLCSVEARSNKISFFFCNHDCWGKWLLRSNLSSA